MNKEKEARVLDNFVKVYCREKHGSLDLCAECGDLLIYAAKRLRLCRYDPKPKCKDCRTHCYVPGYRDKIRAVMRFSGPRIVGRGWLDWLRGKIYFNQ
ncbi:hypothetical protein A3H38_01915 [candidate division WOR-1 bacterium RIFCSPLOWO2_02_FULL_46_20]|uniref:Nitrous oxide-stimulated promoter n=1 Tax=candidate division WOR-1 bacterium RIFCSPLOWO2_02_FULL_46_20 TaxID=1802567 RepID=A0A1F4R4A4_UNCSA|nr:MAG: hypothetical protein A3H38_01915 [candidate division WOR-1 bacterium RIFCSPLOWO2_02_FULL_46_20]